MVSGVPRRPREEREFCPRCGGEVSWFERHRRGDREYWYAVHYLGREGRKKKLRKCYLGPVSVYEYVSRLHVREGLRLKGLRDFNRALEYLDALLNALENTVSPQQAGQVARKLERYLERFRELTG